jgi:hypothetical protein
MASTSRSGEPFAINQFKIMEGLYTIKRRSRGVRTPLLYLLDVATAVAVTCPRPVMAPQNPRYRRAASFNCYQTRSKLCKRLNKYTRVDLRRAVGHMSLLLWVKNDHNVMSERVVEIEALGANSS